MSIYFILALALLNGTSLSATRVVLSLYALELGAQPLTVGMLAAMLSVFPLLLAVPAGRVADRFGARWLLMFGACGAGLSLLLPYFIPGLPALFTVAAMIGLADVIFSVSLQNLVGLLSSPQNRARNFSNYSLGWAISNFAGPLLAGFSIDHSGYALACLYLALFTLAPVALLVARHDALRAGAFSVTPAVKGVQALLLDPGIYKVLVIGTLLNTGHNIYQFYMPVYGHAIGLSPSTIGTVLAAYAAAEFTVRLVLPRLIAYFKEGRILVCAFYIAGVSLMLTPLLRSATPLMLIAFALGLGMGCAGPIILMMMFANSPAGRSAEALGLRMTANHLIKILAPIAFGSVASAFGLPAIFWIIALMLLSGGIISHTRHSAQ